MASTAQAGKSRGVDPNHLSKIWRISHDDAQSTIMSPPKCPFGQMIQSYLGITPHLTGC